MKIRTERKALADTASWVARATPKRPAVAVLAGMRLSASGSSLTMQAFDYDTSHTATLDVEVASDGEAVVPAAFLVSILGGLRSADVEIVLDGRTLTISGGRATYSTQVLNVEEYPTLPKMPPVVGEISGNHLERLATCVEFPIDDASPHEQVRGLHLEGDAQELTAVGANRFFVAEARAPWSAKKDFAATVHSKQALAAIKGLGSLVNIGATEDSGLLGFSDGSRAVTMRTYDAEAYVPWRRLVRDRSADAFELTVDAADLAGVAKRTGALIVDDAGAICLDIRPSEIEVSVAAGEGGAGVEYVDAEAGGEQRVGVNPQYLVGALAAIPSGAVTVGVLDHVKPLVVRAVDHPGLTFVVMPKRIPEA